MVNMQQTRTMPAQETQAWVSALFDGELDDAEVKRGLASLRDDADAATRWRDYCALSDALHGDVADSEAFMARFRGALEAEPTVLAPPPARRARPAPYLWTAAAAAMAAITWTVWTATPRQAETVPLAGAQAVASRDAANDANPRLEAYLAAHQDYAYAVVSAPDIVIEKVGLTEANR